MKQGNVIALCSNPNSNRNVVLVLQILKRKLRKLIFQHPRVFNDFVFRVSGRQLILVYENLGQLFKALRFFQSLDNEGGGYSRFIVRPRKRLIIGRIGAFKTDIQEEKILSVEESQIRISKKFGKKYRYRFQNVEDPSYSLRFEDTLQLKRFSFKNHILTLGFLPNNNTIDQSFFLHIFVKLFREYRGILQTSLQLMRLQSLFLF
jgi:hypothetical protein